MKLVQAVNLAKNCLATSDSVQILTHLCFSNGTVLAYNGVQVVVVKLDEDPGLECAVPGDVFVKLLNSLPSEKTTIRQDEQTVIFDIAKKKSSSIKIMSLPKDNFVVHESDFAENHGTSKKTPRITKAFLDGISKCIDASSDNVSNINLCGIALIPIDKVSMEMFATDRRKLSRYLVEDMSTPDKILLPKTLCSLINYAKEHIVGARCVISKESISIFGKEVTLVSSLIPDVMFLDYKSVLSKVVNDNVSMFKIPTSLSSILSRCLIILNNDKMIRVSMDNGKLIVIAKSALGRIEEHVKINADTTKDVMFSVDAELLKQTVDMSETMSLVTGDLFVGQKDNLIRVLAGVSVGE